MPKQIFVPDIGSDEVNVTDIMVQVGDQIEVDQNLIAVEGDKASMEIPAMESGIIKEILVKVGDKVSTGSPMLILDMAETEAKQETLAKASEPEAKPEALSGSASQSKQYLIPDIGTDEVNVTEVLIKVGEKVVKDQSLFTIEGDKASMEIPSPVDGVVKEILLKTGDKVVTGTPMAFIEAENDGAEKSEAEVPAQPERKIQESSPVVEKQQAAAVKKEAVSGAANIQEELAQKTAFVHATPLIRRLAREFGIQLDQIAGTGRKGRIIKEDIQNYVKNLVKKEEDFKNGAGTHSQSGLNLLPWPKVDFSKFGEIEEIELSKIKKISGANLHRNWVHIPHVTQWDKTDITELEIFRKEQNAIAQKKATGIKITPLVFIVKAVTKALQEFPLFNSSLAEDGSHLVKKKYYNIGFAADTPNGLVVPVLKNVENKGIIELSQEIAELSQKARAGKLTASEMQGGCFTISSLGGIGGTHFSPIINAPEVAILGVSKANIEAVWNGQTFEPHLMLPLSLAYDHRVIDGAEGARFITYLKEMISDIRRLIL